MITKRWIGVAAVLVASATLGGCAKPALYGWGNYPGELYSYYSGSENNDALALHLLKVIAEDEPTNRVPPGIYAEYGYLLMVGGKPMDAVANFEKEKAHFPESTIFMDRMIAMANSGRRPVDVPKDHKEEGKNAPGV